MISDFSLVFMSKSGGLLADAAREIAVLRTEVKRLHVIEAVSQERGQLLAVCRMRDEDPVPSVGAAIAFVLGLRAQLRVEHASYPRLNRVIAKLVEFERDVDLVRSTHHGERIVEIERRLDAMRPTGDLPIAKSGG